MNFLFKEVRDKLGEFVGYGVISVLEMCRYLYVYVDILLFKDMKCFVLFDVVYYLIDEIIRIYIYFV